MDGTAAEPHWLDAKEMDTWLSVISVIIKLPAALDAQLRRDSDMTHFDYQVLAMLSAANGRSMRLREVARVTDSSLSRMSHGVKRLEARGWINRSADPTDARSTIAALTDAGMAALRAAAPGHVATVRRYVFDPLTDEQVDQLRGIASKISGSIGPGVGPEDGFRG